MSTTTLSALARLRRFVEAMAPSAPPIDRALPASRALLEAVGHPFKYVGGVAVVHHGYLRTTEDIDVLIDPLAVAAIAAQAEGHDFAVESRRRLRHRPTNVAVDLLVAGEPMPRPGAPSYPMPSSLTSAEDDPTIVGLAPLCELKLRAHRHRDLADVVELLGRLKDGEYLEVEAAVAPDLRAELASLREDALIEREQSDSTV
jgi:hypothetical protein